ncbi:MAG: hypothetical protein ACK4HV_02815, partial [Parachlamydiaceae bacterium]
MKAVAKEIQEIEHFLNDLYTFRTLKENKWEKVQDEVEKSNRLGTPSEDYIEPPDENKVLALLKLDNDYNVLRERIERGTARIKRIADALSFDMEYKLDWLNFTNPLIGLSALEDAIDQLEKL